MTAPLPLLPMQPLFLEKIWGGRRLLAHTHKRPPPLPNIGEAWEVADLPEGQSTVASGPLAGTPLRALVEQHGESLIGTRAAPGRFPLLVKLIDAAEALSVQVHPGAAYASRHPGTFSKDESWLVVSAEPGAHVMHGLADGVTAAMFEAALNAGVVETLLRKVLVKPGDVLRVAPGTIHAIGAGVTLLECQEPSDTTFRVYDYGRRDGAGKTRPLHKEQALAVSHFGEQPPALHPRTPSVWGTQLAHSPRYQMHLLDLPAQGRTLQSNHETPVVLFVLAGSAHVQTAAQSETMAPLTTLLCPAAAGAFQVRAATPNTQVVVMTL